MQLFWSSRPEKLKFIGYILQLGSCLYTVILGSCQSIFGGKVPLDLLLTCLMDEQMSASDALSGHLDIVRVESTIVHCDGSSKIGESGHPLVYLNMGGQGYVECPYCGRRFVLVEQLGYKG